MLDIKSLVELELRAGTLEINLVTEDDERNGLEGRLSKKSLKLISGLCETLLIRGVDEEDNTIHICEVLFPETTSSLVTTEIVSLETHVAHNKLFELGVTSRFMNHHLTVTKDVKEGRLSGIIQTKENNATTLI